MFVGSGWGGGGRRSSFSNLSSLFLWLGRLYVMCDVDERVDEEASAS